jgi:hypothetical protein
MSMSSRSFVLTGALLVGSLLHSVPAAADPMRVVLTDGSVVTGELVALEAGRIVIKSTSLGVIGIEHARVASMTRLDAAEKAPAAPKLPAASKDASQDVAAAVQGVIGTDPEAMNRLAKLKESPVMQEILSDPELMAKVLAGDLTALAEDPRIKKLLEDDTVRSITKRVAE